jgi:glycosyltransferase involved in cell wall biosynthesis
MQILLTSTRAWYLDNTAKALSQRRALAGLWMADKNATQLPPDKYQRCWPYHLCLKPFYHLTSQIWSERATYYFLHVYTRWLQARLRAPDCPKFDVVHAIMGFATEAFAVAEQRGSLKVVDCPNSHPTTYYGYWQRECDLWCPGENVPIPRYMFARMNRELQAADVVLCPSNFVRDTMVANGVRPEKCIVNPFGVNTSVFTPRSGPPATPRFICVGTICLRKGYQYLFRAFAKVKAARPDAELICVGDIKRDFRKELPQWQGCYTYHPSLRHDQLSELLRSCTAFVFPSCEEGFARVLSEALATGLPVVASYESGATTLVRDGQEGFIVSRDPDAIASAMLRLANDTGLNQSMGQAAYQKGGERNTWQDYGDRLLVEYQQFLDRKSLPRQAEVRR